MLGDLAQSFLALDSALSLYPEGHQARQEPLRRLTDLLRAAASAGGESSLGFADEAVQWRGQFLDTLPPVIRKFAVLMGSLGILRLTWSTALTEEDVRQFMCRISAMRTAGRRSSWESAEKFGHLSVESRDYRSLMADSAERTPLRRCRDLWRSMLLRVSEEPSGAASAEELAQLREVPEDPEALAALIVQTLGPAALLGDPQVVGPMRRFSALLEAAAAAPPGPKNRSPGLAERWTAVTARLPAPLRLRLLEASLEEPSNVLFDATFGTVATDQVVPLLAANFSLEPAQIERLASIFQRLIPRLLDREELAPQLRQAVIAASDPEQPLADNVWDLVQQVLTGETGEVGEVGDAEMELCLEQFRRLAIRRAARRDLEVGLAAFPELRADLLPARTAQRALLIQLEQLRLATSVERYRDNLERLGGLCVVAFLAGDRERGLHILGRFLELHDGVEHLAGSRSEIRRALQTIARPPALEALCAPPGLSGTELITTRAFVNLAGPATISILLEMVSGEEDAARRERICVLLEPSAAAVVSAVLERLPGATAVAARRLLALITGHCGPAAVPVLLALLGHGDPHLRRDALRALVHIETEEVHRRLLSLLEDSDLEIVQVAAARLRAVGCPATVRSLLASLDGGILSARRAEQLRRAIFILGNLGDPAAVAPLAALLRKRGWIKRRLHKQIAEEAARALARIGSPLARSALQRAAAVRSSHCAELCRHLLEHREDA